MAGTTQVKIDDHLHQKMKELAGPERGAIAEEYRIALANHIAAKTQENMIKDSGLETFINDRVSKAENHLAAMMGRTGMDTSMILMGLILLLEKLLKVDRQNLQEKLRIDGARYFSNAVQKDREYKKNNPK